jgi:hypothetical protein
MAYAQTYCCPPGGYGCDIAQVGTRDCSSILSTATEIWRLRNTGTADGNYVTTAWPGAEDDQAPLTVWHQAFPLMGGNPIATSGAATTPTFDANGLGPEETEAPRNETIEAAPAGGGGAALGPGAIAGAVIGSLAFLAMLAGLGLLLYRRRKSSTMYIPPADVPAGANAHMTYYGHKAELPGHDRGREDERIELPADYAHSHSSHPSDPHGGHQRPNELP